MVWQSMGTGNNRQVKRTIYVLTPLVLLLLLLAGINLIPRWLSSASSEQTTAVSPATAPPRTQASVASATTTVAPTTIASPTPSATPTAWPTMPPNGTLALLGPPSGSSLPATAAVTFYWQWSAPLIEGQRFVVYLLDEESERPLGVVTEPNLGTHYQLSVPLGDSVTTGAYRWQIRLEHADPPYTYLSSATRALVINS